MTNKELLFACNMGGKRKRKYLKILYAHRRSCLNKTARVGSIGMLCICDSVRPDKCIRFIIAAEDAARLHGV